MERLLDFFIPKSYVLNLFVDKHKKTIKGTVEITGKTKTADFLKLHSVGQTIDFFKINGEITDYKLEDGVLTAVTTPRSDVKVEVGFHGPLKEDMQGAYLSTYELDGKEERIVSTQFESHYARECFPCVDEPAAKATFEVEIAIPDKDDIVLSNTEVDSCSVLSPTPQTPAVQTTTFTKRVRGDVVDEHRTKCCGLDDCEARTRTETERETTYHWHFKKTPRMSTYLLAFVIGKFNVVEGKTKGGILVRTFAPLNQDKELLKLPNEIAIKSLDYYEGLFKVKYPLEKCDQVAIPDFEAGAMENWGLVTYRESQFLCKKTSSLAVQKSAALTITHELSHQWFGNLVTMKWWNDLWLNESFATIMEYYATDHIFPKLHVWDDFFTGDCLAALYRDAVQGVQAVREDVNDPAEIATLFDPCIVYAKGAHLMLMLIREMSEESFMKGLKDYFEKNAFKNAEAEDLWVSLEPYAHGFSVRDLMTAWLTQPGYPVVTDGVEQRFLLDGSSDGSKYPIPEVKDDMSGHYLVNLSGPEFSDAIKNFKNLNSEQRLRLLIDRMLLSFTPIVSSASLIPLISSFKDETSAPIWNILGTIISRLTLFIDYDSPEEAKFKAFLYSVAKPHLKRLGLEFKDGESPETSELRQTFLGMALYSKNPEFIDELCALYSDDIENIHSDLRPFVLSAKMWRDEESFYKVALEAYENATSPELKNDLRSTLAKPRLPKNINFAFSILNDSPLLKPQDHLSFLLRLRRWKYTKNRALDWTLENWDYIYKINGEKSIEDYPRYLASTIDKEADAEKFFDFFTPLSNDPVLARALLVAKHDIEATLNLIKLDKAAVLRAVNKLS
ncbi:M1 family metallopeptidase [Candidatus Saccharibacteria bacterium]|nr:M1 family metallopeptidase [Candidatus Saccharibacteria bacterium]